MKYFVGILLLALIGGCKSPLDVEANRHKEFPDRDGSAVFKIDPLSVDLGYVHPEDTAKFSFKITNIGSKSVEVTYMEWTHYAFLNAFTEFSGSFSLGPKGSANSERTINCSFTNVVPGRYRDTLLINNYLLPQMELIAKVPEVYIEDVVFRNADGGGPYLESVYIYNRSPRNLVLKAAQLPQNSPFSITNSLPLELPANSTYQLVAAFSPSKPGTYKQVVRIVLENAEGLIVDDEANFTAVAK